MLFKQKRELSRVLIWMSFQLREHCCENFLLFCYKFVSVGLDIQDSAYLTI